jgi:hypothetical protein
LHNVRAGPEEEVAVRRHRARFLEQATGLAFTAHFRRAVERFIEA